MKRDEIGRLQTEAEILAEFEGQDAEMARRLLALRQPPREALVQRVETSARPAATPAPRTTSAWDEWDAGPTPSRPREGPSVPMEASPPPPAPPFAPSVAPRQRRVIPALVGRLAGAAVVGLLVLAVWAVLRGAAQEGSRTANPLPQDEVAVVAEYLQAVRDASRKIVRESADYEAAYALLAPERRERESLDAFYTLWQEHGRIMEVQSVWQVDETTVGAIAMRQTEELSDPLRSGFVMWRFRVQPTEEGWRVASEEVYDPGRMLGATPVELARERIRRIHGERWLDGFEVLLDEPWASGHAVIFRATVPLIFGAGHGAPTTIASFLYAEEGPDGWEALNTGYGTDGPVLGRYDVTIHQLYHSHGEMLYGVVERPDIARLELTMQDGTRHTIELGERRAFFVVNTPAGLVSPTELRAYDAAGNELDIVTALDDPDAVVQSLLTPAPPAEAMTPLPVPSSTPGPPGELRLNPELEAAMRAYLGALGIGESPTDPDYEAAYALLTPERRERESLDAFRALWEERGTPDMRAYSLWQADEQEARAFLARGTGSMAYENIFRFQVEPTPEGWRIAGEEIYQDWYRWQELVEATPADLVREQIRRIMGDLWLDGIEILLDEPWESGRVVIYKAVLPDPFGWGTPKPPKATLGLLYAEAWPGGWEAQTASEGALSPVGQLGQHDVTLGWVSGISYSPEMAQLLFGVVERPEIARLEVVLPDGTRQSVDLGGRRVFFVPVRYFEHPPPEIHAFDAAGNELDIYTAHDDPGFTVYPTYTPTPPGPPRPPPTFPQGEGYPVYETEVPRPGYPAPVPAETPRGDNGAPIGTPTPTPFMGVTITATPTIP